MYDGTCVRHDDVCAESAALRVRFLQYVRTLSLYSIEEHNGTRTWNRVGYHAVWRGTQGDSICIRYDDDVGSAVAWAMQLSELFDIAEPVYGECA